MSNKIIICSGYFNPLHSGHINYLESARALGDYLIVIVNSDNQVKLKGSKPFMDEDERLKIIQSLRCVDEALVAYDIGAGVNDTLEHIYDWISSKMKNIPEIIFANGGDRDENKKNPLEDEVCKKYGIKQVFNTGGKKTQSSSELLENI